MANDVKVPREAEGARGTCPYVKLGTYRIKLLCKR